MVIVETSTFTRLIREVLDEESYRLLQLELAADPGKGVLIPGTGGIFEIRVGEALPGELALVEPAAVDGATIVEPVYIEDGVTITYPAAALNRSAVFSGAST